MLTLSLTFTLTLLNIRSVFVKTNNGISRWRTTQRLYYVCYFISYLFILKLCIFKN